MKLPQTGRWQCGAVRYEITQPSQLVFTCHCTDCQPMTSSAFSMGAVLPPNAFNLIQGTPQPVQRTADSGRVTTWWICAKCGSWVFSGPSADSTGLFGAVPWTTARGCIQRRTSSLAVSSLGGAAGRYAELRDTTCGHAWISVFGR